MSPTKGIPDKDGPNQALAEALRDREQREKTYRERALKMFPWICAWCGRDFSGKKLRELTVHHKDHDHDNNPPDGSNWELLCLYCHEEAHSRQIRAVPDQVTTAREKKTSSTYQPFADLKNLFDGDKDPDRGETDKGR
jgi:hypothetical protein